MPGLPDVACIGLRPEHLFPASPGRLTGTVVHFERLGTDTHVIVRSDTAEQLTVRMTCQGTQSFDMATGLAVGSGTSKVTQLIQTKGEGLDSTMRATAEVRAQATSPE